MDLSRYGGGENASIIHPLVLVALCIAIVIILRSSRKAALGAFLLSTFLIPAGQQILVGGVHFFSYRLVVLSAFLRVASHASSDSLRPAEGWSPIDKLFALWVCSHTVAFCLLYFDGGSLINQIGFAWDYLGGYIALRYLIRSEEDIETAIRYFAYLAVILAVCMLAEQMTGSNVFGFLGGVRLDSQVRDGRIRSEAVFQHAILAGTFGATLIPLFCWLWQSGRRRILGTAAVVAAFIMVISSACSTPLLACAAGLLGIAFWPLRENMRPLRWGIVITLVGLHIVMKAPVWALIQRIDIVQGSSSYHRYELVNQFIRHVGEWWLLGTKSNASWGANMIDTSNAYVEQGTAGGLLTLMCFLALIAKCFATIGRARKNVSTTDRSTERLYWFIGAALFSHVVAFFGIFYFDQTRVAWLAIVAMIVAAAASQSGALCADSVQDWTFESEPNAEVAAGMSEAL